VDDDNDDENIALDNVWMMIMMIRILLWMMCG
jgi:hypothetical protein